MKVTHYEHLLAWQKSMDLVELVYTATRHFPREELYGLGIQFRRAAVSIACNIAEGQGRRSATEFRRYLLIAKGSLNEAETQALIAQRLGYLQAAEVGKLRELASEVGRLIHGLAESIKSAPAGR